MDDAVLALLTCIVVVMVVCGVLLVKDVRWAVEHVTERHENTCFRTGPTGGADNSCAGYWKLDGKFVDLTER